MNRHTLAPVAGLLALLTGCGGPGTAEVEGTVRMGGRPLEGVRVEFLPDPEKGTSGPRSTGVTDADGRFRLVCENQQPGAVVGTHRVLVTDLKQWDGLRPGREDADKPLKPSRLHPKYTDVLKTPFTGVEVKPGGPPHTFDVSGP
ncbi:MAG: hypothetical protein C0501_15140 [Isosphaera sp.]|nr:hypothetical protein [Isosphaera sp.]